MAANLIYKGDDCLYGCCPKYLARHAGSRLANENRNENPANWSPLRQLFTYIQERFTAFWFAALLASDYLVVLPGRRVAHR
jgi:hypothetical protein